MQPFQCDLPPQLQETHRTTHTGTTTRCKTHRRNNSRQKRPQPQPPHRRGTFPRRLQPLYTEKQGFVLRLPPQHKAHATSCSHSNAICHHSFKKRIELRTQKQPLVAKHIGGTIRDRNDRSRNRHTDEVYLSSPAAATLHGKIHGFVLRLPPQHKAHATSCSHSNAICHHSFKKRIELRTQEQPLVAKHIGGTIRDRNDRSRNRRTDEVPFIAGCSRFTRKNTRFRAPASSPTQSPCNIMQPFQCDLPPQLQETHRTTHTGTTTRCKTHRRNNSRQKRPQPQPPHRRGTFHRRLQPLYTEKHKVSCSGFLPNTKPMQHHAAIPMRSATTASRNA